MQNKWGRNYQLTVTVKGGGDVIIEPPFTMEFDIIRNSYASANVCSIRIYNLSEKTRNLIKKDRWESGVFKDVVLAAGYGSKIPVIFVGNVTQAWSVREGSNYITQIECFDGGEAFATSDTSAEFPAGTSYNTIIGSLVKTLPNTKVGKISSFPGVVPKGISLSGCAIDLINQISGNGLFIDLGVVHVLKDKDTINEPIYEISSDTGLLGTPIVEEQYLVFDILFEPNLKIGQQVKLNSITNKTYNKEYKVVGIKHRGVISEVVCGDAKTTVEVFANGGLLGGLI